MNRVMQERVLGNLDFPTDGVELSGYGIMVQGWVQSSNASPTVEIWIDGKPVSCARRRIKRPDVSSAYPELARDAHTSGFLERISMENFGDGDHVVSTIAKAGSTEKIIGEAKFVLFKDMFRRKQERFSGLVVCPNDKSPLAKEGESLHCPRCGQKFPVIGDVPVMLPDGKPDMQYVSTNNYPKSVIDIIGKKSNRTVLDDGAGYPHRQFENVLYFETTDLPSTNVVGNGGSLPFPDESMDAVISMSVIEHVRDPFAYVDEIYRVCKRGGEVVVDSAFMQPVHNHPQHFFNTTMEGIKLLFKKFKIAGSSVEDYQHPKEAVSWMLRRYLEGLDGRARKKFLKKTVSELANIEGFDNVSDLPESALEGMAAGVHIHCTKE